MSAFYSLFVLSVSPSPFPHYQLPLLDDIAFIVVLFVDVEHRFANIVSHVKRLKHHRRLGSGEVGPEVHSLRTVKMVQHDDSEPRSTKEHSSLYSERSAAKRHQESLEKGPNSPFSR